MSNEETKGPIPVDRTVRPAQSIGELEPAFRRERDAEIAAVRERLFKKNGPHYISPWNPRTTQAMMMQRNKELDDEVARWEVAWWQARGYSIKHLNNGAGFSICPIEIAA